MPDVSSDVTVRSGTAADRRPVAGLLDFREGVGRPLDASCEAELQRLLELSREDLRLATGSDPQPGDARALLEERPPGVAPEQRLAVGVFDREERLAAVLDLYQGVPAPGDWFVALAIVRPDLRGRGLGIALVSRAERLARRAGARALHVIAPPRNPAILQLLRRAGFSVAREVTLPLRERAVRGVQLVRALAPDGEPAPA